MPELPDVEVFKRYLDATSLHQEIADIEVYSRQVLEGVNAEGLREKLIGHAIESTHRHGKYLFGEVGEDGEVWLALHFGMTGNLKYFKDMDKEPSYDQVLITFANGYHLAYESQRKLGKVRVIDDVTQFVARKDLGADALDVNLATFKSLLAGRRGMIKSALMDQSLIAGIGNVYSDEILYQERLHPRTPVKHLDAEMVEDIFHTMREVLHTAIDHQAIPDQFPDSYIIPHRHGDGKCPGCGGAVERVKVSGRSAYYCPECQTKPGW